MKHSQTDEEKAKQEKRTACAVCYAVGTLFGIIMTLMLVSAAAVIA